MGMNCIAVIAPDLPRQRMVQKLLHNIKLRELDVRGSVVAVA